MRGRGISWSQIRVGLAVTAALLLLGLSIFFIGETGEIFGDRYRVVTLMPSANGLLEGASVRLAGQDVGKVSSIEFIPVAERTSPDRVLEITLAINRTVREQIREDSEARIRTQGLLGDKIIDITPGSPEAAILEPGDTLPSATAIDYEQMLASASEVVDDLAAMLSNLRSIADSLLAGRGTAGQLLMDTVLYSQLVRTSREMNSFLETMAAGEGALTQLARDDAVYRDLKSVISGLDSLTSVLVAGDGTLSHLLTDDTLYQRLTAASTRADSLLAALEDGEGTLGQLMADQELYEGMLKLLVDIQTVVQEFRESPRKYIPPIKVF